MDFTFTPEQDEAAELAAKILSDRATNERMKAVEADGSRFDRELWAELGSAGLLGLALPEEYDGAGLGLVELCRVLVEVGRTVAPVPLAAHGPAVPAAGRARQRRAEGPVAAAGGDRATWCSPRRSPRSGRSRPSGRPRVATADGDGLPADRQQGDRPGRARTPTRSWCRPRRPTGVACSWSCPGDAGVTVTAQSFSDRDAVARVDLDEVSLGRRPAGRARRRVGGPAAAAPAAARRRGRAARHLRGRAGAHRVVRQDPRAVRPPDRHLPGGLAAAGRRLHRHPRPAADALAGRVAARRGAARRHRGRDREAVGRRRRPPDRAHDRARPRRGRASTSTARRTATSPRPSATSSCTAAPPSRRCTSGGRWRPSRPEPRREPMAETVQQLLRERADDDDRVGAEVRRPHLDLARAPRRGGRRGVGASSRCADPDRPLHVGVAARQHPGHAAVDGRGGARRLRARAVSTPPGAATALLADIRRADCQLLLVERGARCRCWTGSTSTGVTRRRRDRARVGRAAGEGRSAGAARRGRRDGHVHDDLHLGHQRRAQGGPGGAPHGALLGAQPGRAVLASPPTTSATSRCRCSTPTPSSPAGRSPSARARRWCRRGSRPRGSSRTCATTARRT